MHLSDLLSFSFWLHFELELVVSLPGCAALSVFAVFQIFVHSFCVMLVFHTVTLPFHKGGLVDVLPIAYEHSFLMLGCTFAFLLLQLERGLASLISRLSSIALALLWSQIFVCSFFVMLVAVFVSLSCLGFSTKVAWLMCYPLLD